MPTTSNSSMVPSSKPRLSTNDLKSILNHLNIDTSKFKLFIVGIRGYYLKSMGNPSQNDRGIYDDAIYVFTKNASVSFNANTDPSGFRRGRGTGKGKGMAKLKKGLWQIHQFGKHKDQYEALVQTGGPITVIRDGNPDYEDTGMFGINIHKGSANSTSSLGCQTIHPDQWNSFYNLISTEAKRIYGSDKFRTIKVPYILIENDGSFT